MLLLPYAAWSQNDKEPAISANTVDLVFPKQKKIRLKRIVERIAAYGSVDEAAIGYSGKLSEQYERYLSLYNASEEELVQLTDHYSACVKAYAFRVLVAKKSSRVKELLARHIRNRQSFRYNSGCVGMIEHVNGWFLSCATPMLTKEEEDAYRKQMDEPG